jgi:hypothetical protein
MHMTFDLRVCSYQSPAVRRISDASFSQTLLAVGIQTSFCVMVMRCRRVHIE